MHRISASFSSLTRSGLFVPVRRYSGGMKRVSLYLFTSLVAFGLARAQRQTTVRRTGDGGPAIKAEVNAPSSLTVDQFGNIYVYEAEGGAVRRIDAATRNITTVLEECKPPWRKPRPSGCIGPVYSGSNRAGALPPRNSLAALFVPLQIGTSRCRFWCGRSPKGRAEGEACELRPGASLSHREPSQGRPAR